MRWRARISKPSRTGVIAGPIRWRRRGTRPRRARRFRCPAGGSGKPWTRAVRPPSMRPTGVATSSWSRPPIRPAGRPPARPLRPSTTVSLWLFYTQAGAVHDTPTLMLAAGRILGLVGGYLLFIQLLMMSRVSWLEEWVGARDLLQWHRWLGTTLVVTVLGHIVFIVYGYALTGDKGVVDQG